MTSATTTVTVAKVATTASAQRCSVVTATTGQQYWVRPEVLGGRRLVGRTVDITWSSGKKHRFIERLRPHPVAESPQTGLRRPQRPDTAADEAQGTPEVSLAAQRLSMSPI